MKLKEEEELNPWCMRRDEDHEIEEKRIREEEEEDHEGRRRRGKEEEVRKEEKDRRREEEKRQKEWKKRDKKRGKRKKEELKIEGCMGEEIKVSIGKGWPANFPVDLRIVLLVCFQRRGYCHPFDCSKTWDSRGL